MRDVAGWEIGGEFYPLTFSFKWGDVALVHEVTGLTWEEFEAPIIAVRNKRDDEDVRLSGITMVGLLAVSLQRGHPDWSRAKTRKYVEELDFSLTEMSHPDDVEEEPNPPEETAGESSTTSAGKSESGSEQTSSESTRSLSGTQTSLTSPEGPSATAT